MYDLEIRKRARDLFVERGQCYEVVAERTGISISQLKKYGGAEKWIKQRGEHERAVVSADAKILQAMDFLVDKILMSVKDGGGFDPQEIFAAGKAIEALILVAAYIGAHDLKPVIDALSSIDDMGALARRLAGILKARKGQRAVVADPAGAEAIDHCL